MSLHAVVKRVTWTIVLAAMPVMLLAAAEGQKGKGKAAPAKPMSDAELAAAKPGRDPNQPIDEEYTKKIKEYTTEPFFLSPLVDYLPAVEDACRRRRPCSATSPARRASCRTRRRSTSTCGCSRRRRRA